jgi:hypothetical protein
MEAKTSGNQTCQLSQTALILGYCHSACKSASRHLAFNPSAFCMGGHYTRRADWTHIYGSGCFIIS